MLRCTRLRPTRFVLGTAFHTRKLRPCRHLYLPAWYPSTPNARALQGTPSPRPTIPVVLLHAGCTNRWPSKQQRQAAELVLRKTVEHGTSFLNSGASAVDIAVEVVRLLEDCELFNAGIGAALTAEGDHELEAGVIDGTTGAYGAVAATRTVMNPVCAAHCLLSRGPHKLLVGPAADAMAAKYGCVVVDNAQFTVEEQRRRLSEHGVSDIRDFGTVGAIVLDLKGTLAAAGSTGSTVGKLKGRIGDTAIIGAGLYADSHLAAVCSGAGDAILQNMTTAKLAGICSSGVPISKAVQTSVKSIASTSATCAIMALDAEGNFGIGSSARSFSVAVGKAGQPPMMSFWPATESCSPQAVVYEDETVLASLASYPSTPGHTKIELRETKALLLSLPSAEFSHVMLAIKTLAEALLNAYDAKRCALVTTGGNTVSLIPLHGLDADWKPVTSDVKEFHPAYPGYITSHDGPKADDASLQDVCSRIQKASALSEPFNCTFHGPVSDSNLFARIVRGELPQYRVWEDDEHVAFLTPFANTPGFTVLVPRTHLTSDVLRLDAQAYTKLILAAKTVSRLLTKALDVPRCGMIFEGFEIDYAHIKLIPIHASAHINAAGLDEPEVQQPFHETYQGFVTSLDGPTRADTSMLSAQARDVKAKIPQQRIQAPRSWHDPVAQFNAALQQPWHSKILSLQDTIFHASNSYFHKTLGFKYALVPSTTDAVSSPMGLGSDSEPVRVRLLGQETHLADSMQFTLEYFLRVGPGGVPGVYYVGTSFRGEDTDAMHLSQFYHVECELLGGLDAGIAVAEKYVVAVTKALVGAHADAITSIAGSLDHATQLLAQYDGHGSAFPRVTLAEALALPTMTSACWRYVAPEQPDKGKSLTRAGEQALIAHFGGAVWLTEMDHMSVPFYQAYPDSTHAHAKCADLLIGAGETLGLGERHDAAADVKKALREHQVALEPYEWYCSMRELKPMRTTGWGLGMERYLAWALQHDDIRDIAIIPRLKGRRFAP